MGIELCGSVVRVGVPSYWGQQNTTSVPMSREDYLAGVLLANPDERYFWGILPMVLGRGRVELPDHSWVGQGLAGRGCDFRVQQVFLERLDDAAHSGDAETLLGSVESGVQATFAGPVIFSEARFPRFAFSTPSQINRLSAFVGGESLIYPASSPFFLLRPLHDDVWGVMMTFLLFFFCYKSAVRRLGQRDPLKLYENVAPMFVALYTSNLRAILTAPQPSRLPFGDLGGLVRALEDGSFRLIIDRLDDYRFQLINGSSDSLLRRLRAATAANPPLVIPDTVEMIRTLGARPGLVAIDNPSDFFFSLAVYGPMAGMDPATLNPLLSSIEEVPLSLPPSLVGHIVHRRHTRLLELINRNIEIPAQVDAKDIHIGINSIMHTRELFRSGAGASEQEVVRWRHFWPAAMWGGAGLVVSCAGLGAELLHARGLPKALLRSQALV